MVITNNEDLYNKLEDWKNNNLIDRKWKKSLSRFLYFFAINVAFNKIIYNAVNWLERRGYLNRFVKYYDESTIDMPKDWNHAPSEIEARVGRNQLRKYDEIIQTRRANAKNIIKMMQERKDIWMMPFVHGATYSHVVGIVDDRDRWIDKYYKNGIQLGILIEYSIPEMKAYSNFKKNCPTAKKYSNKTINFPVWESIRLN